MPNIKWGIFEEYAKEQYPHEACAIIDSKGELHLLKNSAVDPTNDFVIRSETYAEIEDKHGVKAIIHSHPDESPLPSPQDAIMCRSLGVDFYIYSVHSDPDLKNSWEWLEARQSLLGREFYHGAWDCYSLIQDYYERELNIQLPFFHREDRWWEDKNAEELYLSNLEMAGFVIVDDLKSGDMIVMRLASDKANHAGVFLGDKGLKTESQSQLLNQNSMLHHVYGRLSNIATYGGFYQHITACICRHKEML